MCYAGICREGEVFVAAQTAFRRAAACKVPNKAHLAPPAVAGQQALSVAMRGDGHHKVLRPQLWGVALQALAPVIAVWGISACMAHPLASRLLH